MLQFNRTSRVRLSNQPIKKPHWPFCDDSLIKKEMVDSWDFKAFTLFPEINKSYYKVCVSLSDNQTKRLLIYDLY